MEEGNDWGGKSVSQRYNGNQDFRRYGGDDVNFTRDGTGGFAFYGGSGTRILRLADTPGATNFLSIVAAAAGNGVRIVSVGSDANVDLLLEARGPNGRVRIGTFTSSADVAVNGSIEIKDLAGNTRRLATIA